MKGRTHQLSWQLTTGMCMCSGGLHVPGRNTQRAHVFTWTSLFTCSVCLPVCLSSCNTQRTCTRRGLPACMALCCPAVSLSISMWRTCSPMGCDTHAHAPISAPANCARESAWSELPTALRSSRGRGFLLLSGRQQLIGKQEMKEM